MKKILSLALTLALLATMCVFTGITASAAETPWDGSAATAFSGGGNGTAGNPYKIGTAGELKLFANIVNGEGGQTQNLGACAVLTADITLNANVLKDDGTLNGDGSAFQPWTPIGTDEDNSYSGNFDGQKHTISGMYAFSANTDCFALFGYVSGGTVQNIILTDSYIASRNSAAGICGYNYKGSIINCHSSATIAGTVSNSMGLGGICGDNNNGSVQNCSNTGLIFAQPYTDEIGGVCGNISNGATVKNCFNSGNLIGAASVGRSGGVVGCSYGGLIENCINTGTVSGNSEKKGGICFDFAPQ